MVLGKNDKDVKAMPLNYSTVSTIIDGMSEDIEMQHVLIENSDAQDISTETKTDLGEPGCDIEPGPSGYPNIEYPTFEPTVIKSEDKSGKKTKVFNLTAVKKLFSRNKKIFDFYCCDVCKDYSTFSSKGFRCHRVTVHRIGVQKYRTWDRFGHPFEQEDAATSPTSEIKIEDLDEHRQLEWALKDSALMYAAK
ncbi:uncharacterized protein TNCV_3657841 [Trichonephila clavipes]|nr:uncharacterized protein TNCV_3657841 [Trichonephila clavipes]